MLELATALEEPDVQGPTALTLALLAADESVGATMLGGGGLRALDVLLRSTNHDAVRCAACALALLCARKGGPARVVQAFTPAVLVMVLRSDDFFLQCEHLQLLRMR